jgi:predicted ribosome quality control (RQC) complex YloA/Tae2 family protein
MAGIGRHVTRVLMANAQLQRMANLDYRYACGELADAIGGRLDQVYEIEENLFRFRIGTKESGKIEVAAKIGERFSRTVMIPDSPDAPTSFASLLRKKLGNAVVEEIAQVSLDRLVVMRLRKDQTHLLYFEMFAKGNVVLCDTENTVVAAYHEQKEGKRIVARGVQYPVPQAAADPFDAKETERAFEEAAKEKTAENAKESSKAAAKKIALSPAYFDDFAKAADWNDPKKASKALEKYVSAKSFTAYYDEKGVATGFSAVKLNDPAKFLKAKPASEKTFGKFSDCLDEYYSKADVSGPASKSKNAKLDKLLRQKALQEKSIAETMAAADGLAAVGDAIYLNFDKVEAALEKAKADKKRKIEIEI